MNPLVFLGGLFGYAFGRWNGLVVGALFGWIISRLIGPILRGLVLPAVVGKVQTQFLDSTFAVMGAVCKADGQVSAEEIRVAEALFDRLHLSGAARESAKSAFNRGKSPGFDVDAEVAAFARASRGQRALHQMFLQVQLSALTADGTVHPAERAMIERIARGLGLSDAELQWLEALLRGAATGSTSSGGASSAQALDDAYRVLGVAPSASDAELKQAYRKLMSQHHPDKLAAKGLPESMREMAEQRTREISAAYDRIERARRAAA